MAPESTAIAAHTGNSTPAPPSAAAAKGLTRASRLAEVVNACTAMTDRLAATVGDFWQVPVTLSFVAVSARNLYFWKTDDFYVSQLPLDETPEPDRIAQLRISDNACACLLSQALGSHEERLDPFRFDRMTNFEAHLLTDFSKELFASLLKHLVSRRLPKKKKPQLVHLVWALNVAGQNPETEDVLGKIVLTLPLQSLKLPSSAPVTADPLPDELFFHAHAPATVHVGKTRLPLEDLQHLEPGDIVILQKSQADHLALIEPESSEKISFTAEIAGRKQLEVPYTQELAMMEQQQTQSAKDKLWNNLMIDVNAEFFPTRMPLDHLKQMSEGLIVEVGELTRNQVRLHIEGRTVALGELVIVGEKFGVRISEVADASEPSESDNTLQALPSRTPSVEAGGPSHPMEAQAPQEQAPETQQPAAGAAPASDDDWLDDDFGDDEDDW